MFRTISLIILAAFFSITAVSCAPNMPEENPKYKGGVQGVSGGGPKSESEIPKDDPAVAPPKEEGGGSDRPSAPPPPPPTDDSGE